MGKCCDNCKRCPSTGQKYLLCTIPITMDSWDNLIDSCSKWEEKNDKLKGIKAGVGGILGQPNWSNQEKSRLIVEYFQKRIKKSLDTVANHEDGDDFYNSLWYEEFKWIV